MGQVGCTVAEARVGYIVAGEQAGCIVVAGHVGCTVAEERVERIAALEQAEYSGAAEWVGCTVAAVQVARSWVGGSYNPSSVRFVVVEAEVAARGDGDDDGVAAEALVPQGNGTLELAAMDGAGGMEPPPLWPQQPIVQRSEEKHTYQLTVQN